MAIIANATATHRASFPPPCRGSANAAEDWVRMGGFGAATFG
jgi:hypothetical protein